MSLFKARPWYFIWEKAGMNGEKESIIIKLKENGCRITKQRKIILDIILQEECTCCKEIYFRYYPGRQVFQLQGNLCPGGET